MKRHGKRTAKRARRESARKSRVKSPIAAKPVIIRANPAQTRRSTLDPKHTGFVCPKCGYPAHKLTKLTHCPLCVICDRCGFSVRNCKCREGE